MKIELACATWVTKEDEAVIQLLEQSERKLSVEEIVSDTGLPPHRVERTLRMLRRQSQMLNSRKKGLKA